MSAQLSPALARHIDRLARRAHAFHRFAHHPLCDRYASELIAVGRRQRICRGCSAAALGACAGVAFAALAPASFSVAGVSAGLGTWAAALTLVGARRFGKLWTRAVPCFALAAAFAMCLRIATPVALTLASCIALTLLVLRARYMQRGPDRSPCASCPERTRPVPCAGFRDIVRAERAFQRRSHTLLSRTLARH
jgi:hypothetical protein